MQKKMQESDMNAPQPRAAVTLITDGKRFVLIKRKERSGDPWSGHMALPGGFIKDGESDLEASKRECLEEVGFLPSKSEFYGRFGTHISKMFVSVFVDVENIDHAFVAGDEVESVHVVRRNDLRPGFTAASFPCYYAGGHEIWGLTYRILTDYFSGKT